MDYNSLKKFNQLPPALKARFSTPETIATIDELEQKYRLKLAMVFIALVVNDLDSSDLENYLLGALGVAPEAAKDISRVLLSLLANTAKSQLATEMAPKPAFDLPATGPALTDNQKSPSLTFSTADEAEVNYYRPLVNDYKQDSYEALAQALVAESGYRIGDAVLAKRLENIVTARLKQVRDDIETLEVLQRNTKVGMGLAEEQAQVLLRLIKNQLTNNQLRPTAASKLDFTASKPLAPSGPRLSLKEKAQKEQAAAIDFDLSKLKSFDQPVASPESVGQVDQTVAPTTDKPNSPLPTKRELLPEIREEDGLPVLKLPGDDDLMVKSQQIAFGAKPPIVPVRPPLAATQQAPLSPEPPMFEPVPRPAGQIKVSAPPLLKKTADRKPSLDGVKIAPKLVGPIEELSGMTLIDFRRLGADPRGMTNEIKEKINLLAEDSYGKKLAGVEAWHQSEVNKFYRLLGQASMLEGKSIETIISERLAAGKPTLSLEEFNAVMELNKELRY